ncbi:hypothetical protein GRI75_11525 [Altererythrobacter soli]|uniref:Uncharacterized protein n=1 Tax=Croceibacterium soli TaxID=1739690 RepID=A0A6I4UWZ2_9SPHN|nr:hypothetical protein [Croceibacterium soli]MXP42269.1 hypothetical protein [Croceibacterium soli]
MGEYEPDDSRDVTLSNHQAPGEPPRTGPREDEARARALQDKVSDKDKDTAHNAEGEKEEGFAKREDGSGDVEADESSVPFGN